MRIVSSRGRWWGGETVDMGRIKGGLLFLGMLFAGMIVINFSVRNFVSNHPNSAAAQALAQLI